MEKSSYSLSRRLLAMLLCIAMLVPAAVVPASATEVTEPTATVSTETVQTEETGSEESEPEWILPDCDCGSTETELGEHGETCARKVFLEQFCEETAAAIYAKWEQLPEECRNYVLEYLGKDEANAEKLAELKGYIDAAAQTASEDAEETTGETEGTTDETEGTTQETEGSTDETEGTTQATEGAVEETEAPTEPTMLLSAESDGTITVIAGSDFQNTSSDHSAGANVITEFMNGFVNAGYSALDGFLFCGDYIYNLYMTEAGSTAGKEALELAVWNAYGNRGLSKDAMVWVQGNHDPDSLVGDVLTKSGANDAAGYGVYVINEKDYMWYTNDEATVKNTAAALETYLDAKVAEKYTKPIFIVSHLPLHYSMRTSQDGDARYANYIFDVLNEAGADGLNIIFLFGHDHSNGWDDYLGGSAVYLAKGDTINIAQASQTNYAAKTLNFTYMNAGYVAYYTSPTTGAETELTMTVFQITEDEVTVTRRTTSASHDLKSAGVKNTYKGDTFEPDTRVISSPQTITLNKTFRTTATSTETGVSVSGMGITGVTVTKVEQDVPAGYVAYATYDITPEGYAGGEAKVTIEVDDSFDASRSVTVIDVKTGNTQTCSIVNGKVTFTATHFSLYTVAQTAADSATGEGTLDNYLVRAESMDDLVEGVPYVISDYKDSWKHYMLTNTEASYTSSSSGTFDGLLLDGEPDANTSHVWYLKKDGEKLYIVYGAADRDQYLLIDTSGVWIGEYEESKAAYIEASPSGYGDDDLIVKSESGWLNRRGGTSSSIVATYYEKDGYSYWHFDRVVSAKAVEMTISVSSQTITEDGTSKLTPAVAVGGATATSYEVTWASGDTAVATVSNGVVTPVKQGTTVITATLTTANGTTLTTPIVVEVPITVAYVHKTADAVTAYTTLGNVVIETAVAPAEGIPYVLVENVSGDALTGDMMYTTSAGYKGYNETLEGLEIDADYQNRDELPVWYYVAGDDGKAYLRFGSLTDSDNYLVYNSFGQVALGAKSETKVFDTIVEYKSSNTYNVAMSGVTDKNIYLNQLGGSDYNVAGVYSGANTSRWKFYEVIKDLSLSVSPNTATIYPGDTVTLTPTVMVNGVASTSGNVISWSSSNTAVATVSNGKVTAKSGGTAVITASLVAAKGTSLGTTLSVEIPIVVTAVTESDNTVTATVTVEKKLQSATLTIDTASGPYIITNYSSGRVLTGSLMTEDNPAYHGLSGTQGLELTDYNDFTELWYYDGQYLRYGSLEGTDNYLVFKDGMVTLGTKDEASADDSIVDAGSSTYGISAGANADSTETDRVWLNQYGGNSYNVVGRYLLKDSKGVLSNGSRWRFYTVIESREATLSLTPSTATIYEGQTVTLTPSVTLNGVARSNVQLKWTTSDERVATVYKGTVTGVSEGAVDIGVEVLAINNETFETDIHVESIVTVIGIKSIAISDTTGSVAQRAGAKDETGATMTVTYTDGTTAEIPVTVNMLTDADGKRVSTYTAGTYEKLTITYGAHTIKGFTLTVYAPTKPDYPDYPAEGSVYVDKTGVGIDFQCSGTAEIELTAAGIPSKTGADVIIMLDTSSSMWSNKIDDQTRLEVAAESLNNLLDQLRATNDGEEPLDIRVAVAEFNTYFNKTYHSASEYYLDPSDKLTDGYSPVAAGSPRDPYVYTGSKALNASAFVDIDDVPYFTAGSETGKIALSYQTGTNYDYAFDAIYQLADAITEANSSDEPRDLFVILMSDGCPFQYNYIGSRSTSTDWNAYLTGTLSEDLIASDNKDYYNEDGKNWMAEAIKGDPTVDYPVIRKNDPRDTDNDNWITLPGLGATMYVVGFCMQADGNITVDTMHTVNKNVASSPEYYYTANTAAELNTAFSLITNEIQYAASNAYFIDEMGENYDLLLGTQTYQDSSKNDVTIESKIEVRSYSVWTQQDAENELCDASQVGNRKTQTNSDGSTSFVYTVLETVTFNDDGTEAYSDQLTGNILTEDGVICAKNFWYNTTSTAKNITLANGTTYSLGAETFYWYLGTISNAQLTLSYYVHLTDATSVRGETVPGKEAGIYDTNEHAELYYVNYIGNDCVLSVPTPKLPWQQATVGYGFYLVDEYGNPIVNQATGETGSFDRAVKITEPVYQDYLLNSGELEFIADILASGVVPEGYTLFDDGAKYEVSLNSNGTGHYTIVATAPDGKQTTYIVGITSTPITGGDADGETVNTTGYATANTVVWFGVVATVKCVPDTVVIDYGLPVNIDVLANDLLMKDNGYLAYIGGTSGFEPGDNQLLWEYLNTRKGEQTSAVQANSVDGKYGVMKVVAEEDAELQKEVRYTLNISNGMQMKEEETFVYAVKYTGLVGTQGYYYSTVTVIPATSIYYEDSFVTYTVWNVSDDELNTDADKQWKSDGSTLSKDQAQDRPGEYSFPEVDANNIYGYDGAYTDMAEYSMGSAMKVTVNNEVYGEVQFTFWGTGFDIISLTSGATGTITVDVYKTSEFKLTSGDNYNASAVKSHMVDTYYGYKRVLCNVIYEWDVTENYPNGHWVQLVESEDTIATEESKVDLTEYENPKDGDRTESGVEYVWIANTSADNTLYQVPVMKVSGLDYNQYTAVITVYYKSALDHQDKGSYDFYLDAVRIYDPANDGDGNQVIEDAYVADGEGWPEYFELRNLIISSDTYNSMGDSSVSGIVFIDNTSDEEKNQSNSIADYTNYGPNNELYLAPGQSIAFDLDVSDPTGVTGDACDIAGIHLAMKSVGNTANVEYYAAEKSGETVTITDKKSMAVTTATDLYYDITNLNGKTVVIKNVSGSILSITNVKVTYTGSHEDCIENTYFTTSQETAGIALLSLRPTVTEEPEVPEETTPETTVPEETVPETTVPEETIPETTAPEETVPETTVPEEEEPEVFELEKFNVRLSDSSVKVGSKVTVTVTTGADVDYITVNGTKVTKYSGSRFSSTRTWQVRVEAETVGEQAVTVVCYNSDDLASLPVTRTFAVTEQYTSITNVVKDLITGFFDRLWGSR